MGALVRPYASQVGEATSAEGAGVRPLARVNALVDFECPRLAETLATVGADVGPCTCVHIQVDAQIAVRVEGAAALGTQEAASLGGMLGALVLQQLGGPGKGGRAVHARMPMLDALLLGVALLVAQQLSTAGEGALAGQTGEKWW